MGKTIVLVGTAARMLVFATPTLAQHGGPAGGHGATPPQEQKQAEKGMCAAMMAGMQGGPQAGGMMGGGMMGMMASADPATMQMRGEFMKAMGEIMMKYGKALEKPAH